MFLFHSITNCKELTNVSLNNQICFVILEKIITCFVKVELAIQETETIKYLSYFFMYQTKSRFSGI